MGHSALGCAMPRMTSPQGGGGAGGLVSRTIARLATSVCQLRHDPMEQGPTEPHGGRSTFLLGSGGAGGRVLLSGLWYGPIETEHSFPCQTLVACLTTAFLPQSWRSPSLSTSYDPVYQWSTSRPNVADSWW